MRVDVVTLFPEMFAGFLATSFVARAIAGGQLVVRIRSPRDFGLGKHRSIDDTPYGGGSGMVMRVDVHRPGHGVARRRRARRAARAPRAAHAAGPRARPGARSTSSPARDAIMLVCGRYEGFDERVRAHVDEEISLGDFVMTGGEVAAMAIVEACARLLPGVLGNEASTIDESHSADTGGLLEYPHYTRPAEFRGERVPERPRRAATTPRSRAGAGSRPIARTQARRPDLWERFRASQREEGIVRRARRSRSCTTPCSTARARSSRRP